MASSSVNGRVRRPLYRPQLERNTNDGNTSIPATVVANDKHVHTEEQGAMVVSLPSVDVTQQSPLVVNRHHNQSNNRVHSHLIKHTNGNNGRNRYGGGDAKSMVEWHDTPFVRLKHPDIKELELIEFNRLRHMSVKTVEDALDNHDSAEGWHPFLSLLADIRAMSYDMQKELLMDSHVIKSIRCAYDLVCNSLGVPVELDIIMKILEVVPTISDIDDISSPRNKYISFNPQRNNLSLFGNRSSLPSKDWNGALSQKSMSQPVPLSPLDHSPPSAFRHDYKKEQQEISESEIINLKNEGSTLLQKGCAPLESSVGGPTRRSEIGISGREAVAICQQKKMLGEMCFLYLNYANPNANSTQTFNPYDLVVVSRDVAAENHHVMSPSGIVHVVPGQPTDTLTLAEWMRDSSIFVQVNHINFFYSFPMLKCFYLWKLTVQRSKFRHRSIAICSWGVRFFPELTSPLLQIAAIIEELRSTTPPNVCDYLGVGSLTLRGVGEALDHHFDECKTLLSSITDRISTICMATCESIILVKEQKLQQNFVTNPKESIFNSRQRHMDQVAAIKRACEVTTRLHSFLRLVDYMIQTVITKYLAGALHSLKQLLFRNDSAAMGLLKTKLIYKNESSVNRVPSSGSDAIDSINRKGIITLSPAPKDYSSCILISVTRLTELSDSLIRVIFGDFLRFISDDPVHTSSCSSNKLLSAATSVSVPMEINPDNNSEKNSTKDTSANESVPLRRVPPPAGVPPPLRRTPLLSKTSKLIFSPSKLLFDQPGTRDCVCAIKECVERGVLEATMLCKDVTPTFLPIAQFLSSWDVTTFRSRSPNADLVTEVHNLLDSYANTILALVVTISTPMGLFVLEARDLKEELTKTCKAATQQLHTCVRDEVMSRTRQLQYIVRDRIAILSSRPSESSAFTALYVSVRQIEDKIPEIQNQADSAYALCELGCGILATAEIPDLRREIQGYIRGLLKALQDAREYEAEQAPIIGTALVEELHMVDNKLNDMLHTIAHSRIASPTSEASGVIMQLRTFNLQLQQLAKQKECLNSYVYLMEDTNSDISLLHRTRVALDFSTRLWTCIRVSEEQIRSWTSSPFLNCDLKEISESVMVWKQHISRFILSSPNHPVVARLENTVAEFRGILPIIFDLGNPALKPKHWRRVFEGMGARYTNDRFSLNDLLTMGALDHALMIKTVANDASAEQALARALLSIQSTWAQFSLTVVPYCPSHVAMELSRNSSLSNAVTDMRMKVPAASIVDTPSDTNERVSSERWMLFNIEEVLSMLEEHLTLLHSMLSSRHVTDIRIDAEAWNNRLAVLAVVLEEWMELQRKWIYLDVVFSQRHLREQMGAEALEFGEIDAQWHSIMHIARQATNANDVIVALRQYVAPQMHELAQWTDESSDKNKGVSLSKVAPGARLSDLRAVAKGGKDVKRIKSIPRSTTEESAQAEREAIKARTEAAQNTAVKAMLKSCSERLDIVLRSLDEHLEQKRLQFPRLYFLSDEEMLSMLAQSASPHAVQRYLRKCFSGVVKLHFHDPNSNEANHENQGGDQDIVVHAAESPEGEILCLDRQVIARDGAETWLHDVEESITETLARCIENCVLEYPQVPVTSETNDVNYTSQDLESACSPSEALNDSGSTDNGVYNTQVMKWMTSFPAQCVLVAQQLIWTEHIESALGSPDLMSTLLVWHNRFSDYFNTLVAGTRNDAATSGQRVLLSSAITLAVHFRDVIDKFIANPDISGVDCFDWIIELRICWQNSDVCDHEIVEHNAAMMMDEKKSCRIEVRQLDLTFPYGYEYLGNTPRLVVTPLTQRCYIAMTTALGLYLGASPIGPAGTGKTETINDLAKAMAIHCIVFNCSKSLDIAMMTRFFSGLLQMGAWACFDEINRMDIEVLSTVGQHLQDIRNALKRHETSILFSGRLMNLNCKYGCFITMNPTYGSRTTLPDLLKSSFRTISMIVPDFALIAEVMLFSSGFTRSRSLAGKLVCVINLACEQLTIQPHYDLGLRSVKVVLERAFVLRRHFESKPTVTEEMVLKQAINDSNVPKLVSDDINTFKALLDDVFVNVPLPRTSSSFDAALEASIRKQIAHFDLVEVRTQLVRILQLYSVMRSRHGVMIVGEAGSGKTTCWRLLAGALTHLSEQSLIIESDDDGEMSSSLIDQPNGDQPTAVEIHILNPKACTLGQMFGQLDRSALKWTDGIVGRTVRMAVSAHTRNIENSDPNQQWIVFDSSVDSSWVENLNSVLDETRTLCLPSGERIMILSHLKLLFEADDLSQTSPATASRCGMVYLPEKDLGWEPILLSWRSRSLGRWPELKDLLRKLYGDIKHIVKECLIFHSTHATSLLVRSIPVGYITMMITMVDCHIEKYSSRLNELSELDPDAHAHMVAQILIFCTTWTFGSAFNTSIRTRFDSFLRQLFCGKPPLPSIVVPFSGTVFDFEPDFNRNGFILWQDLVPMSNTSLSIVPTLETVAMRTVMAQLLLAGHNVLLVGPPGVGKTSLVRGLVVEDANLNSTFTYDMLTCSRSTPASAVQNFIQGALMRDRIGKRSSILNRPSTNISETIEGNSSSNFSLARRNTLTRIDNSTRASYGPKHNMARAALVIDDVNVPDHDEFGCQTHVEMIRDCMNNHGWQDVDRVNRALIRNTQFVAVCSAVGSLETDGNLSPRFIRHFCVVGMEEISADSLAFITLPSLRKWINEHTLKDSGALLAACCKSIAIIYLQVKKQLLPCPSKPHYDFGLRDITRVVCGMCLLDLQSDVVGGEGGNETNESSNDDPVDAVMVAQLWAHECLRVFCDRLIMPAEAIWVRRVIAAILATEFSAINLDLVAVFDHPNISSGTSRVNVSHSEIDIDKNLHRTESTDFVNASGPFVSSSTVPVPGNACSSASANLAKSLSSGQYDPTIDRALEDILFSKYIRSNIGTDSTKYRRTRDCPDVRSLLESHLEEYKTKHNTRDFRLVFFKDAVHHMARLCRTLMQPDGHGDLLLIGIGGTGRQTLTRLAAHIVGCDVAHVRATTSFTLNDFHECVRNAMVLAGARNRDTVLLLTDAHITDEYFLEDLVCFLKTGDIPGLFTAEDIETLATQVIESALARHEESQNSEKTQSSTVGPAESTPSADGVLPKSLNPLSMSKAAVFAHFLQRARFNLRIVLCLNSNTTIFRQRVRRLPALISCCTINYFSPWPEDALHDVALGFLCESKALKNSSAPIKMANRYSSRVGLFQNPLKLTSPSKVDLSRAPSGTIPEVKQVSFPDDTSNAISQPEELSLLHEDELVHIATSMTQMHLITDSIKQSRKNNSRKGLYSQNETSMNSLTPSTFLDMLLSFVNHLSTRHVKIMDEIQHLLSGLATFETAQHTIKENSTKLLLLKPELHHLIEDNEVLMKQLEEQKIEVELAKNRMESKSNEVLKLELECAKLRHEATVSLDQVLPMYNESIAKLRSLDRADIMELKSYVTPPEPVQLVLRAVCVLLEIDSSWNTAKKLINMMNFWDRLENFNQHTISEVILRQLKRDFLTKPLFDPDIVGLTSLAARTICVWVHAAYHFGVMYREISPKKQMLKRTDKRLRILSKTLNAHHKTLTNLDTKLHDLRSNHDAGVQRISSIQNEIGESSVRLQRAEQLTLTINKEWHRWESELDSLNNERMILVGESLLLAGTIAYLGEFDVHTRDIVTRAWQSSLKLESLDFKLERVVGDPSELEEWRRCGLPVDQTSIHSALIMKNTSRWPLIIDPHHQARDWLRVWQKPHGILIITSSDPDLTKQVSIAVRLGSTIMIVGVDRGLDPALDSLINKDIVQLAGRPTVSISGSPVDYHKSFQLYLICDTLTSVIAADLGVRTSIIDFDITLHGLADRLLSLVVEVEHPWLEQERKRIGTNTIEERNKLKEARRKVLDILQSSLDTVLNDDKLLLSLKSSHDAALSLTKNVSRSEQMVMKIEDQRRRFFPVATRGALLYFIISEMALINPMYQFSLPFVLHLFRSALIERLSGVNFKTISNYDLSVHISKLKDYITHRIYRFVTQGIYLRHRMLLAMMTAASIRMFEEDEFNRAAIETSSASAGLERVVSQSFATSLSSCISTGQPFISSLKLYSDRSAISEDNASDNDDSLTKTSRSASFNRDPNRGLSHLKMSSRYESRKSIEVLNDSSILEESPSYNSPEDKSIYSVNQPRQEPRHHDSGGFVRSVGSSMSLSSLANASDQSESAVHVFAFSSIHRAIAEKEDDDTNFSASMGKDSEMKSSKLDFSSNRMGSMTSIPDIPQFDLDNLLSSGNNLFASTSSIASDCSDIEVTTNTRYISQEEWRFFLRGHAVIDKVKIKNEKLSQQKDDGDDDEEFTKPNVDELTWMSQETWRNLLGLESCVKAFEGLSEHIANHPSRWHNYVLNATLINKRCPLEETPVKKEIEICVTDMSTKTTRGLNVSDDISLKPFHRLLLWRVLKDDAVFNGCRQFVKNVMGSDFVVSEQFDARHSLVDLAPTMPVLFLLCPGSDPTLHVKRLAGSNYTVNTLSLGRNQGAIAEQMVLDACISGHWVLFCNCHIVAENWLLRLEQLLEELSLIQAEFEASGQTSVEEEDTQPVTVPNSEKPLGSVSHSNDDTSSEKKDRQPTMSSLQRWPTQSSMNSVASVPITRRPSMVPRRHLANVGTGGRALECSYGTAKDGVGVRIRDLLQHGVHPSFRLWLTTEPTENFPRRLLRSAFKVTDEPPYGVKAQLKYSAEIVSPLIEAPKANISKSENWSRLICALALLHAIVLNRRQFGSLGWNTPHEWALNDLDVTLKLMQLTMGRHDLTASRSVADFLTCSITYGGQVVDKWDGRTLSSLFDRVVGSVAFGNSSDYMCNENVKNYSLPVLCTPSSFADYIKELPEIDAPEIFGLGAGAGAQCNRTEANSLISQLLITHPEGISATTGCSTLDSGGSGYIDDDSESKRDGNFAGDSNSVSRLTRPDDLRLASKTVNQLLAKLPNLISKAAAERSMASWGGNPSVNSNCRPSNRSVHRTNSRLVASGLSTIKTSEKLSTTEATESTGSTTTDEAPKSKISSIRADGASSSSPVKLRTQALPPFLLREVAAYRVLLNIVRNSLEGLRDAFRGQIVMSVSMEKTAFSLFFNRVPSQWLRHCYPTCLSLGAWITDLIDRVLHIDSWVTRGLPSVVPMHLFFRPRGFLTSVLQQYARESGVSIETLSLQAQVATMTDKEVARNPAHPPSGTYVSHLWLQGASWDSETLSLSESSSDQRVSPCPIMWLIPSAIPSQPPNIEEGFHQNYVCPVYQTVQRAEHSDHKSSGSDSGNGNFVLEIALPSRCDPLFWVQRGVAILCQKEG